ncbi:MAG TPA: LUD domain-containing protein, partial [Spirochaetota bacterium]|nr:LUD domain-containing protein [Spirochaetota bacterium]
MNHYDEIRTRHEITIIESVAENLRKRDFEAMVLNSNDAVRQYIESEIQPDQTVGFGGSVTVRELGLDTLLRGRGNTVF